MISVTTASGSRSLHPGGRSKCDELHLLLLTLATWAKEGGGRMDMHAKTHVGGHVGDTFLGLKHV